MKKQRPDPHKPVNEDSQGHGYQHELGDPDRAAQLEDGLEKARTRAAKVSKTTTSTRKEKSRIVTRKRR